MRNAVMDESHKLQSDCREKYQQPQICNDTALMKSMNSVKRQKRYDTKDELPSLVGAHMLLEKSGEITTERMKRQSQSENKTQLWM